MTHVLPALPYPYDALQPYISEQIMRLHHTKHHQGYVNALNAAEASYVKAATPKERIALQAALKFNGGGRSLITRHAPHRTPRSVAILSFIFSTCHINCAPTRSLRNARLSTRSTTFAQAKFKDQDRCLSDTTRKIVSTLIATARLGSRVERAEFRKHEEAQLDVSVEDSSTSEKKGRGVRPTIPAGPQLPGRKPHAAQYVVEREDVGERRHNHLSAHGA
ncbi:hypothetical protein JVT61DRAFT_10713 [Boletus reticuloceps]|uniref:superoxide dismutase n=1 Tax=Boletus reticuloceps TaxID=495285 RepID=A0A8I2YFL1_9AGAM|nr:hypothetical protein JVT61DRAFT_10713 [Boletus reticuloceps]